MRVTFLQPRFLTERAAAEQVLPFAKPVSLFLAAPMICSASSGNRYLSSTRGPRRVADLAEP
jgi:hypothetical protein